LVWEQSYATRVWEQSYTPPGYVGRGTPPGYVQGEVHHLGMYYPTHHGIYHTYPSWVYLPHSMLPLMYAHLMRSPDDEALGSD